MRIARDGKSFLGWIAVVCIAAPFHAIAQTSSSAISGPPRTLKSGINLDAMTLDDCRARLALPKRERPRDPDARVDLDAVCANMLNSPSRPRKPTSAASDS